MTGCASSQPAAEPEPATPVAASPRATDTSPSAATGFAVGDWTGLIDPANGPSQTVVISLWGHEDGTPPAGRAMYSTPSSTCRYSLSTEGASEGRVTILQRLVDGDCADGVRLVLRPGEPGHVLGEWFLPDGTHLVSTQLNRPETRYFVTLDGFRAAPVAVSQRITFSGLAVGDHTLELHGIPEGCEVMGPNPRTVTTEDGGTLEAVFEVWCPFAPEDEPPAEPDPPRP